MQNVQLWRRKRIGRRATLFTGLALAGLAVGGMALGAAGKPKMQVLPSPYGLKYSQTVRVKAQNLPQLAPSLSPLIAESTVVISGTNGIPWWFFHDFGGALANQPRRN